MQCIYIYIKSSTSKTMCISYKYAYITSSYQPLSQAFQRQAAQTSPSLWQVSRWTSPPRQLLGVTRHMACKEKPTVTRVIPTLTLIVYYIIFLYYIILFYYILYTLLYIYTINYIYIQLIIFIYN